MHRRFSWQSGFTLVEIMVALVLGLVLTAGATYLFISNKQTYRMADAVSQLQERGRFLLRTVAQDLRMAGHLGCVEPARLDVVSTATALNAADLFTAPVVEDSDRLSIRYASAASTELAGDMATPSANLLLAGDSGLEPQNHALITNCTRGDLFTVTGVTADATTGGDTLAHGNALNASANLNEAYEVGTGAAPRVRSFRVVQYGVADAGTNSAGDSISELRRNGEAVVRGVEAMVTRFGECVGTDQVRFVSWSNVGDATQIVAVRVGFLLHSIDRVLENPDTQTYRVVGEAIDPPDGLRLRRVFATTVSLRNERVEDC